MYPSDMSDEEWSLIEHYFARRDKRGTQAKHNRRSIVNAIFYVTKTGCQWHMLPKEFPNYKTVNDYYCQWNLYGVWERALDAITQLYRKKTVKLNSLAMVSSIRRV